MSYAWTEMKTEDYILYCCCRTATIHPSTSFFPLQSTQTITFESIRYFLAACMSPFFFAFNAATLNSFCLPIRNASSFSLRPRGAGPLAAAWGGACPGGTLAAAGFWAGVAEGWIKEIGSEREIRQRCHQVLNFQNVATLTLLPFTPTVACWGGGEPAGIGG